MNRKLSMILLALLYTAVSMTASAQENQPPDLKQIVLFHWADGEKKSLKLSEAYDVGIDHTIYVDWDEALFSRQLGIYQGVLSTEAPLLKRIELLENVMKGFIGAQGLLVEWKAAAGRLEAAKLAKADSDTIDSLRQASEAASKKLSNDAWTAINLVETAKTRMDTAEDRAMAADLYDKLNLAILSDNYDEVSKVTGNFLALEVGKLNRELAKRLDQGERVQVFMEAWLTGSGEERALHLDGYDDRSTSRPVPFSRFQLALSERTTREAESARRLAEVVENSDQLITDAKTALAAINEELEILSETLDIDAVTENLASLGDNLRGYADASLLSLTAQARELAGQVKVLVKTFDSEAPLDAVSAMGLMYQLSTGIDDILAVVRELPRKLTKLVSTLDEQMARLSDRVSQETVENLRKAGKDISQRPEIQQLIGSIEAVGNILGRTARISETALATGSIGRDVAPDKSLDTFLELMSAGERHPGDTVTLHINVEWDDGAGRKRIVASAIQQFKIRAVGPYVESRGSLLFVDPQRSDLADQSYEPAIALSFMCHYNRKGWKTWNDIFNPGLGLTFSLLDFEDGRDFELGISGSFTLFGDLIWAGYGRNLQAEADFFYIGINPLAVGDFLKQSGISLP
jgi:hypothetical protein